MSALHTHILRHKVPEWTETGKRFIPAHKTHDWEVFVKAKAINLHHGLEIEDILHIIKELKHGHIDYVVDLFESQMHSEKSAAVLRNAILFFSERGLEFYNATHHMEQFEEVPDSTHSSQDLNIGNDYFDILK